MKIRRNNYTELYIINIVFLTNLFLSQEANKERLQWPW